MLKYLIGAVLLILSVFAGYVFSYKYYERLKFYESFCEFNKRFKTAVSFSFRSFSAVTEDCGKNKFTEALSEYKADKRKNNGALQFLNEEERAYFWNYAENIGTTDRKTQLNMLEEAEKTVCEKYKKCENDYKKYKPIYIKLGFLFGLIIFILIL